MEKKLNILLVDDEEGFTMNLAKLLTNRGFNVTTAFDGFQALDEIKFGGRFDVVVLDIKMPGMDGIATLNEIKKWAPDTEVIILTGHATLSSGVLTARKGAYEYLFKPCDIDELCEKINRAKNKESVKKNTLLWSNKKVSHMDLLPLPKLLPKDSIIDAYKILMGDKDHKPMDEVYILDRKQRLIGAVNRNDILKEVRAFHPEKQISWDYLRDNEQLIPGIALNLIVRREIPTAQYDASLTDVADEMIREGITRVPVLSNGKVVGALNINDIFRFLEKESI